MAQFPEHVEVNEASLAKLTKIYKTAYKQVVKEIQTASDFGVAHRKVILKQIDGILTELGTNVNDFIKKEIPDYYKIGADQAVQQLNDMGASIPVKSGFNVVHRQAIANLVSDTASSFADSIKTVGRSANTLLNRKMKAEIQQRIATGMIKGSAVDEATKSIKQYLTEQGLSALKDKAGKTWQLDTYAEMLYRTKTVEARNMGLANRMLENGYDLVQVSSHFSTHYECSVWEGKILSLTGETEGYPTVQEATDEGLFHPNCRHAINAIVPELANELQAYNPVNGTYEEGGGLTL